MEKKLTDNFVVALIDDDKRKLKALDKFDKVVRLCTTGLKLYTHPARQHYFIQISPAIEKWILVEAEKAKINLEDYDLPNNLTELVDLKDRTQRDNKKIHRLFQDMLQNESCSEIRELKRWLIFFRDNHYNSNIEAL